jgi:hypothetical protein
MPIGSNLTEQNCKVTHIKNDLYSKKVDVEYNIVAVGDFRL